MKKKSRAKSKIISRTCTNPVLAFSHEEYEEFIHSLEIQDFQMKMRSLRRNSHMKNNERTISQRRGIITLRSFITKRRRLVARSAQLETDNATEC